MSCNLWNESTGPEYSLDLFRRPHDRLRLWSTIGQLLHVHYADVSFRVHQTVKPFKHLREIARLELVQRIGKNNQVHAGWMIQIPSLSLQNRVIAELYQDVGAPPKRMDVQSLPVNANVADTTEFGFVVGAAEKLRQIAETAANIQYAKRTRSREEGADLSDSRILPEGGPRL